MSAPAAAERWPSAMEGATLRPTAAEAWADLALAVRRACERLIASDGAEGAESLSLRHALTRLAPSSFPVEAASARTFALGLMTSAKATIDAGLPEMRLRMAPGALAMAEAVEGLLADRLAAETARWRAHMGEGTA